MRVATLMVALIGTLSLSCGDSQGGEAAKYDQATLAQQKTKFPETEEAVAAGAEIFRKHCALCHGDEGKGDGGSAKYLDPRPRDFSLGLFKFRSTRSGELPTDEDLFRVISRGVAATAMPAWGEGLFKLTEQQRWQVAYFVKTLGGEDFGDPEFDPYREGAILPIGEVPKPTPERIEAGKALFTDAKRGGCVKCHGPSARGNGEEAGAQRDDWGDAILARDLTKGWQYKAGSTLVEIYRTLSTGMMGTPMPGYADTLGDEQRWDIAMFVHSLIHHPDRTGDKIVTANKTGEIPADPFAEQWLSIKPVDLPMLGQIVFRPRHHNITIDMVQVRALYTDGDIALHVMWHDRTKSVVHHGTKGGEEPIAKDDAEVPALADIDDTYVPTKQLWARRAGKFRDSLQLQFPATAKSGAGKPFFVSGGSGGAVNQWRWFADREASGQGRAFEERNQNGVAKPATAQDDGDQALTGKAAYDDGRWALIMRRSLVTDSKKDAQFQAGDFIPFAVQSWDGGNGEEGLLCSVSSWYYLRLDAPIPTTAYMAAVAGALIALLLVQLFVVLARRATKQDDEVPAAES